MVQKVELKEEEELKHGTKFFDFYITMVIELIANSYLISCN